MKQHLCGHTSSGHQAHETRHRRSLNIKGWVKLRLPSPVFQDPAILLILTMRSTFAFVAFALFSVVSSAPVADTLEPCE